MKPTQIKILNEKEKQQLVAQLNKQFGIKKVDGMILMRGQERLFLFQGALTKKQIRALESTLPIERVGIYFGKNINGQIRLSIEGTHILKNQITKNIFELSDKQAKLWMQGNEILLDDANNQRRKEVREDNKLASDSERNRDSNWVGGLRARSQKEKLQGFVAIKHKDDFLGCGKASAEKITNFVPKNRRLKK